MPIAIEIFRIELAPKKLCFAAARAFGVTVLGGTNQTIWHAGLGQATPLGMAGATNLAPAGKGTTWGLRPHVSRR